MVFAKKVLKFFHEHEDEKQAADRPKPTDTELGIQQAYAGFVALSACDPFAFSSQNISPVFIGPEIQ